MQMLTEGKPMGEAGNATGRREFGAEELHASGSPMIFAASSIAPDARTSEFSAVSGISTALIADDLELGARQLKSSVQIATTRKKSAAENKRHTGDRRRAKRGRKNAVSRQSRSTCHRRPRRSQDKVDAVNWGASECGRICLEAMSQRSS